jgi:hypothetical protein
VRFLAGGLNTVGSVTLVAGAVESLARLIQTMILLTTGTNTGGACMDCMQLFHVTGKVNLVTSGIFESKVSGSPTR